MSASKHTPGPWEACRVARPNSWSVGSDGDVIADLWRLTLDTHDIVPMLEDQAEANARLIAASPALLAACEAALACLEDWECADGEAGDELRSAIRLAKGEQTCN